MALFHIVSEQDWAEAQRVGVYRPKSLTAEGFIHLSDGAQVNGTLERFFRERTDLVLLVIDRAKVEHALRYEEGEPGEWFPHLYSELKVDAVMRVLRERPWNLRL